MSEHLNIGGFRYRFRLLNADGSVADDFEADNLVPQDGLSFLLLSPFGDSAPISTFYCGLWRANVLPSAALKATDIPSNLQEFVGYSEATRPCGSVRMTVLAPWTTPTRLPSSTSLPTRRCMARCWCPTRPRVATAACCCRACASRVRVRWWLARRAR